MNAGGRILDASKRRSPAFLGVVSAVSASAILLSGCATAAAPRARAGIALEPDSSISSGHLENGLSYYFRRNADPKSRIILRLAVKAGSLEEGDGELGAAHFVEHMAFRGTRSFPGDGIAAYMRSLGLRVGAELNARTGYGSTEYRIELPSDDPDAVRNGFAILRDWADGILLDPASVERERGVVLEEERHDYGKDDRAWRTRLGDIYGGSRYSRSPPIGTGASIGGLTAEGLRAFYERWYRPDLMAVIAVGDLDAAAMEAAFREAFADLPRRSGPPTAPRSIGARVGTRISVAVDRSRTTGSLELSALVPAADERSEEGFLDLAERSVALDLLNRRFAESLRRNGTTALLRVAFGESELSGDSRLVTASASFVGCEWREAVAALSGELASIEKDGFDAAELARVREGNRAAFADRGAKGLPSSEWAANLSRTFLEGATPISVEDRQRLLEFALARTSGRSAARYASYFLRAPERIILLSLPASDPPPPARREVAAAMAAPIAAARRARAAVALGAEEPAPEPVAPAAVREVPGLGIIDLEYANGARVLLKRSPGKREEAALYGIALRGSGLLTPGGSAAARYFPALIPSSGFPGMPGEALRATMEERRVSLALGVDEGYAYMRGGAGPEGLDLLLRLVHGSMTQPLVDPGRLSALERGAASSGARDGNPARESLRSAIARTIFPDGPDGAGAMEAGASSQGAGASRGAGTPPPAADEVRDAFLELFGSARGFVFCFAGNFDPQALRALCDRYIGSLPSGSVAVAASRSRPIAGGASTLTLRSAGTGRATIVLVFTIPSTSGEPAIAENLAVTAEALRRDLRDRLRVAAGGSYASDAAARVYADRGSAALDISFETSPERADELAAAAKDVVEGLRRGGLDKARLDSIVLSLRRGVEASSAKNAYVAHRVAWNAARGLGLDPVAESLSRLGSISPEGIGEAMSRYLDPANLREFLLLPEDARK